MGLPGLDELLGRLDGALARDDRRAGIVAAVERALAALTGCFEDLAVVRGGRIQLALLRGPGRARVLIAASASDSDRAALLGRLRRDERTLAIAGELLGLALGIPGRPRRGLADRARRIVELGAELVGSGA